MTSKLILGRKVSGTQRSGKNVPGKKNKTIENRAAGIADTVQRGLGMLPQQAICEDWPRGKIEKMSKPVQVYTACQFVNIYKYVRLHSGMK